MKLSAEELARIEADQARINAMQIAQGARENPMEMPKVGRSIAKIDAARKDKPAQVAQVKSPYKVNIRNAADVAAVMPHSSWLLRPYIERDAIAMLYGDFGTYKSFVTIDWALRISLGMPALGHQWPAKQTDVVLVSAEGRALPQRLRGWCIHNFPGEEPAKVLKRASLYCVEHPVNLSDPICALALVSEIDELMINPGFVVIDTMSRNSDGRIENSTTDAAAYLATIDQGIRARYGCGVLLTHHVGHAEKSRIRGPIVLAANTDALIRIERPDPEQRIATITVDRLKDSEPPKPQGLRAEIIDLGEVDDDGQPMTTLALEAAEAVQDAKPQQMEARGKAQRQILAAIRAQNTDGKIWTTSDIREAGRLAGMHRNSARQATDWLSTTPHLTPTVGGWKLNG